MLRLQRKNGSVNLSYRKRAATRYRVWRSIAFVFCRDGIGGSIYRLHRAAPRKHVAKSGGAVFEVWTLLPWVLSGMSIRVNRYLAFWSLRWRWRHSVVWRVPDLRYLPPFSPATLARRFASVLVKGSANEEGRRCLEENYGLFRYDVANQ